MPRSTRRGPWLPEEDATLLQLVHLQGPNNWVRISQHMQHRSPKQCRERYHQNLKANLNHEPISPEEGELIERLVQDMGKRWAEIARRLGNRSDNAVKNWWNGSLNRRKRHHPPGSMAPRGVGPRSQPIPATESQMPSSNFGTRPNVEGGQRPYFTPLQTLALPSSPDADVLDKRALNLPSPRLSLPSQFDLTAHQQTLKFPQPYLPKPDIRGPPSAFEAHSAPTSLATSPHPASFRPPQLSPGQERSRPPPLESRHSYPPQWQLSRTPGAVSMLSPAASEFSSLPPANRAPSLVSDNQSHYSISPKTVSSPRPSLPAPIDTSQTRLWNSDHRRNSLAPYGTEQKYSVQDEGYVSALPASTPGDSLHTPFTLDLSSRRSHFYNEMKSPTDTRLPPPRTISPPGRDSRMTVSRLLD